MELDEKKERIILALNRDGARAYKSGDLVETTGLARSTFYYHLKQLKEKNLVSSPNQGKNKLTEKGKEALEEIEDPVVEIEPEAQNARFKGFEDKLPSEPHKALFELAISVVYAKQNLFSDYEKGWPGLVLYGPTKTYKTGLAEDVVKAIGIDPAEAVKNLENATPGEIGGRHDNSGGKWTMETSYALDYKAFVFDELDEADSKVKDKIKIYLQSKSTDMVEGEKIDLQMVPLVTLNTEKIEEVLPDSFIRRSFLMDTSNLGIQEDIDLQAPKIKKYLDSPLCNPERTKQVEFPDDLYKSVREIYKPFLKGEFWRNQADLRPVVIPLKGRMLSPLSTGDPQRDLLENNYRVLQLAETRGKTVDNWRLKFAEKAKEFGDNEELRRAFEKKERKKKKKQKRTGKKLAEIAEKQEEQKRERFQEDQEELDFIEEKYVVLEKLKNLHDALKHLGSQKANREVKPIRKKLEPIIKGVENSKDVEDLEHYAKLFHNLKNEEKFKEAVQIAKVRRETDPNLKRDICNWENFLSQKELDEVNEAIGGEKGNKGKTGKRKSKQRELSTLEESILKKARRYQKRDTTRDNEDVLEKLKEIGAMRTLRKSGRKRVPEDFRDNFNFFEKLIAGPLTYYDPGEYEGVNGHHYDGKPSKWENSAIRSLLSDLEQIIKDGDFDKDWMEKSSEEPYKTEEQVAREELGIPEQKKERKEKEQENEGGENGYVSAEELFNRGR